jgi:sigma-B regulation protein RsbU (phosphoserine phosphatase)
LLCRERVVTRLAEPKGNVLGLLEDATFEDAELQLVSGDVLLLYSDGIVQVENQDRDEFGEERLMTLLSEHANLPLQDLCKILLNRVKDWGATPQPVDDMLLVSLRVLAGAPGDSCEASERSSKSLSLSYKFEVAVQ